MLQATVTLFTVQAKERLQKFSKTALSLIGCSNAVILVTPLCSVDCYFFQYFMYLARLTCELSSEYS